MILPDQTACQVRGGQPQKADRTHEGDGGGREERDQDDDVSAQPWDIDPEAQRLGILEDEGSELSRAAVDEEEGQEGDDGEDEHLIP